MKVISNQDHKNAVINIDDHYFENCTLIGCTFIFSGSGFEMQNCRIVDCRSRLAGEAAKMIQLLAQLDIETETFEDSQPVASSWVH